VLFGDGAGAFVLQKNSAGKGLLSHKLGADGKGANLIKIELGGAKNPLSTHKNNPEQDYFFQMDGTKVYEFTKDTVPETVNELLTKANLTGESINWIVLHQANIRIIDLVAKITEIERRKFICNIEKIGNTSAGSIPLAFDYALNKNIIQRGEKIMLLGFGGGLSWGGVIIEY
jgi:3-oxoacyl-[acyl-carrier-protein] synthase-3